MNINDKYDSKRIEMRTTILFLRKREETLKGYRKKEGEKG